MSGLPILCPFLSWFSGGGDRQFADFRPAGAPLKFNRIFQLFADFRPGAPILAGYAARGIPSEIRCKKSEIWVVGQFDPP